MTISATLVDIPVRLDFDQLVPRFSRAVASLDHAATGELDRAGVEPALRELVRLRASQLNGCAYCVDLHTKDGRAAGVADQKLHAVAIWRDSGLFTAAERAALDFTESVTRLSETHVPDSVVDHARAVLGEEQLSALLALVIAINVWNAIGVTTRCWSVHRDAA
jgi:AhpD family alkylhydroperoxidase